jgi:uncharacterized membrane protein
MTFGTAGRALADVAGTTARFRPLASSALAGAATGSRSLTGLAGLTLAARPGAGAQPDRTLGRSWATATASLAAATEIGLDKLPSTPSRLAPPGLASRLAGAAACGVIIARREPGDAGTGAGQAALAAACAATGAGTAVAAAWLGVQWRAWASGRFGRDWIGAVIEDAAAISLATAAASLATAAAARSS